MKYPWMPFYVQDFQLKTLDLDNGETGVYFLLILLAWSGGKGCVPGDMKQLKLMLQRMTSGFHGHTFNRIVPKLLKRYFYLGEDGNYYQKRVVEELEKADRISAKNSMLAKKRWQNVDKRSANGEQTPDNRSANDEQTPDKSPAKNVHLEENQQDSDAGALLGRKAKSQSQIQSQLPIDIDTDGDRPPAQTDNWWEGTPGGGLAHQIATLCGKQEEFELSGWHGCTDVVRKWLDEPGWTPDAILSSVKSQLSGVPEGSVRRPTYFEKGIAKYVAMLKRPLPVVVELPAKTVRVRHGKAAGPDTREPWQKRRDEHYEALAELDASIEADKRAAAERAARSGEEGGVEIIPPAAEIRRR